MLILLTLIKKEIKQFFRSKLDVVTMFVFPLVLILVMGSALNGTMSMDRNIFEDKTVYFNTNDLGVDNKNVKIFYDFMSNFQKSTEVNFKHAKTAEDGINYVNKEEAICFVDIHTDDYNYYRNEKKESTESKIFRNVFEQYLKKYLLLMSIHNKYPQDIQSIMNKETKILLKEEIIEKEEVNSYTYYTFTILTLIMLYISYITCKSMYNEKNVNTFNTLEMLKSKKMKIILAKVFLGVAIGIVQIIVIYISSKALLKVNWGLSMIETFLVLISLIIFSSILGIFMSLIFKDKKTACGINNILLVFMGFLGGSYVPISLVKSSKIASTLCKLVPNYWANISLISISYNVDNYYSVVSVILSLVTSVFLLKLGIIISKLKLNTFKLLINRNTSISIGMILPVIITVFFSYKFDIEPTLRVGVIDKDNSYVSQEIIDTIKNLEDVDVINITENDYKIDLITQQIQMVVIINENFEENLINLKQDKLVIKSISKSDAKSVIESMIDFKLDDLMTISKLCNKDINKFKELNTDYNDIPTQLSLNSIEESKGEILILSVSIVSILCGVLIIKNSKKSKFNL